MDKRGRNSTQETDECLHFLGGPEDSSTWKFLEAEDLAKRSPECNNHKGNYGEQLLYRAQTRMCHYVHITHMHAYMHTYHT